MADYHHTAPHSAPGHPPAHTSRKRPFEGGETAGPPKKEKTGDEKSHDANVLPEVEGGYQGPDEETLLRVLAESRHCGGLIGRGGTTINSVRQESGATVEVKSPVPYANKRILRIKGPLSKVTKALHLVLEKLAEVIVDAKNRKADRTKSGAQAMAANIGNDPETLSFEFTMLIPGPQIGAIIGKGGCNITETRNASGTSIAVAAEYLPNSSEKTVAITGTYKSIGIAAERIVHQVATCNEKGEAEYPYEPQPEDDASAAAASHAAMYAGGPPGSRWGGRGGNGGWTHTRQGPGGARGGRGGRPGRGGGGRHGGGPSSWNTNPYNTQSNGGGWGGPPGGDANGNWGGGNGGNSWDGGAAPTPGVPPTRWGGSGANGAPAPGASGAGSSGGPEVTVPFPVSKSLVGAVIGRGGQNITAIRTRSGATVRIEDTVDGADERMITITGTGQQVKSAVTMIQYHLQHQ